MAKRADAESARREGLAAGEKLGRYLIIDRVGGGGMGVVYKALDTELHRTVALKVLPPHLCKNPDYLSRFRAEAQAHARLNSPHVVALYSMMDLPAGVVLVLEYVAGETLDQRIRCQGPLPVAEATRMMQQALIGADHIHRMGVVHRDLKPGNIFIAQDGSIKIVDFGVAKLMDGRDHQRGTMVGTLLYMSPEQINGRETDWRSDIYTLGITLFEAVTGRLPFEGRTDYALMHAHVQESPPRPQRFKRQVPAELEWIILKAIEKNPDRRFQSAVEFRSALLRSRWIKGNAHRTRATMECASDAPSWQDDVRAHAPRPRSRWLTGFRLDAALIAVAFGLVVGLGFYPADPPAPDPNATQASKPPKTTHAAAAARRAKPSRIREPAPKPVKTARTAAPLPAVPRRVKAVKPAAAPPVTARSKARRAATPRVTRVKPRKDKYDSLRKAWGG